MCDFYDLIEVISSRLIDLLCRQPHKLCIAWIRHGRRLCSEIHSWESMVDEPYRGIVSWSVPENITATVTLFHTGKLAKCEDKNWVFVVENVSNVILSFYSFCVFSVYNPEFLFL